MAIELRLRRLSATSPGTVDEKALLQALSELVSEYMVPSRFWALAELPINPNGKVEGSDFLASWIPRTIYPLGFPQTPIGAMATLEPTESETNSRYGT